jgi:hypothetical protein
MEPQASFKAKQMLYLWATRQPLNLFFNEIENDHKFEQENRM